MHNICSINGYVEIGYINMHYVILSEKPITQAPLGIISRIGYMGVLIRNYIKDSCKSVYEEI